MLIELLLQQLKETPITFGLLLQGFFRLCLFFLAA